jgi:hypothetical protein
LAHADLELLLERRQLLLLRLKLRPKLADELQKARGQSRG